MNEEQTAIQLAKQAAKIDKLESQSNSNAENIVRLNMNISALQILVASGDRVMLKLQEEIDTLHHLVSKLSLEADTHMRSRKRHMLTKHKR